MAYNFSCTLLFSVYPGP